MQKPQIIIIFLVRFVKTVNMTSPFDVINVICEKPAISDPNFVAII